MQVSPGDHLLVTTARGERVPRRAVTGVVKGDTFPIVWVCDNAEYEAARREGREPETVPWPASAVEHPASA
jgi:hypothetical protein